MNNIELLEKAFVFFGIPENYRKNFGKIRELKYVYAKLSLTDILYSEGVEYKEIAKLLGVHRTTILWYLKGMKERKMYDKEFLKKYNNFKKFINE